MHSRSSRKLSTYHKYLPIFPTPNINHLHFRTTENPILTDKYHATGLAKQNRPPSRPTV